MRDWLGPFESEMRAALSPSWQLIERVALLWRVIYSVVADERFPKAYLLRHEDLSRDPCDGYRRLYDALGLTFTTSVVDAVRASSSSENPSETTVEQPHETHLDSASNLGNWRHRLDAGRDRPDPSYHRGDSRSLLLRPQLDVNVARHLTAAVKRHPRLHRAARRARSAFGHLVPPRSFDGIPGRVHFNDFMFLDSSPEEVASYAERARNVLALIEETLAAAGKTFDDVDRWLDFGCGYGRVLRFLVERVPAERISATDVIEEGVEFCRSEFGITALRSQPELDSVRLGSFDFIYAISVITHLNERNSRAFLQLVGDSLTDGGIVMFTTHGRWSMRARGRIWPRARDAGRRDSALRAGARHRLSPLSLRAGRLRHHLAFTERSSSRRWRSCTASRSFRFCSDHTASMAIRTSSRFSVSFRHVEAEGPGR